MIPSASELTLLRTRPQSTRLWLSVYKPPTVLACQISGSHSVGSYQINYDAITSGSFASVESGMTMYIGSTPGASDIGKIRVRSATASQITVAENADINWADNQYLTVIKFWEINAIFPRIIQDPADPENTIWYKDYDIAYTLQNDVNGSFVCMGSHYAGFLEGGSHQVYYTASGTSNVMGDTVTYNWWFQGATTTGSSSHTPGNIAYNTPGYYTTRLQVTTPSGTVDTSYRHVSIYDRPENGVNVPILRWNLQSLGGSRDAGGYSAKISVYEQFGSIVDGALVVIFSDDYYGQTKQSIGTALNRGSIVFIGYILDGSISINYKNSSLEFIVGSPSETMKLIEAFAVGVNSSSDPANEPSVNENIPSSWAVVKNMNVKRALYHYLRWHSTVLMTNDFEFSGTDQDIQFFDADRESIYSAILSIMEGALAGEAVCNRSGKMWVEISAAATNNASTAFSLNMSLENFDWIGDIRINEVTNRQVSFLEMGGIYFPGPGFESTPLLASSPGASPSYRGSIQRLSGLALASQAQLNTLVGNAFAWKNSRYPSVQLALSGHYRNLDIAPIEKVQLTVSSDDNIRGISWNRKNFVISGMDFEYDPSKEIFLPSVDLHEITQGIDGVTIVIPPVPPTTNLTTGGGFTVPTLQIPAIPAFPIITLPAGNHPNFVSAIGGRVSGTYVPAHHFWGGSEGQTSVPLLTNQICDAYSVFRVPENFIGTLTIYTAIVTLSAGSGNIYIEVIFYKAPAISSIKYGGGATYTSSLAADSFTGDADSYQLIRPVNIPVSGGEIIDCYFSRKGQDGSDTCTAVLGVAGWQVNYV